MRRLRWLAVALVGICVLVLAGGWMLRPHGATCEIGPNKAKIRWVSWEEAHAKPIVDIPLPNGSRLTFPKPALKEPPSDRRIVAGYLIVPAPSAYVFVPDRKVASRAYYSRWPLRGDEVTIPVIYAESEAERKCFVMVASTGEEVPVTLPYDPTKLPSRYGRGEFSVGPYTFTTRITDMEENIVRCKVVPSGPRYASASFESSVKGRSGVGSVSYERFFQCSGLVHPNGDLLIKGRFIVRGMDGKKKIYPIDATIKPK